MQKIMTLIVFAVMALLTATTVYSHCEIPCGIYDDQMRIQLIREHIGTIEKSMKKIEALKKETDINQVVRWVMNKEKHASEIQHIVTQYFMTQRIKPKVKSYQEKLVLLHKMLLLAMKCKQTTDLDLTTKLKSIVDKFDALYFQK